MSSTENQPGGHDSGDNESARNDAWTPFAPPQPAANPPSLPVIFEPPTATVVEGSDGPAVVRRSRGKVLGGIIAAVALIGAGGFAVTRIVAGDEGGAANPHAVGEQLMSALADEDALGVVDLLLPGERQTFRQPLIDLVDNLKRLRVADSTATLDKIGGLDLSFQNIDVEEQPTNVDDITNLHITAAGTASIDGQKVPIGDLLIDEAFGGTRPQMDSGPETTDLDWHVTTVERDGRWYLSAFYSVAEGLRAGTGRNVPEAGVVARGADTPEGALQAVFDALHDRDLEGLLATLDPTEAEALLRYAPVFLDDAQRAFDDAGISIDTSDVKYSISGSGDQRTIGIDSFTMHVVVTGPDGVDVTVQQRDNGCTSVTVEGEAPVEMCRDNTSFDKMFAVLGTEVTPEFTAFIDTMRKAFADIGPLGVEVHQVDGKWYIAPIRTYASIYLAVLGALDDKELTAIIDAGKKAFESGLFVGGWSEFPMSADTEPAGGDGQLGDALAQCYAASAYDDFRTCLDDSIAAGAIDESLIPPQFRFIDCGVAEQYWDGSVYSMSDTEFIQFVEAAAPCFRRYVEDGTIFQFELPYELSKPECLEGRNWYNVDDSDYSNRVFECAT